MHILPPKAAQTEPNDAVVAASARHTHQQLWMFLLDTCAGRCCDCVKVDVLVAAPVLL